MQRAVAPFPRERFRIEGANAYLSASRSLSLTLALHELATNAVKHGALSNAGGKIAITWELAGDRVSLRWHEMGGPPVAAPAHKGFGSTLIEQASDGKTHVEFAPDGVVCIIEMLAEPAGAMDR